MSLYNWVWYSSSLSLEAANSSLPYSHQLTHIHTQPMFPQPNTKDAGWWTSLDRCPYTQGWHNSHQFNTISCCKFGLQIPDEPPKCNRLNNNQAIELWCAMQVFIYNLRHGYIIQGKNPETYKYKYLQISNMFHKHHSVITSYLIPHSVLTCYAIIIHITSVITINLHHQNISPDKQLCP